MKQVVEEDTRLGYQNDSDSKCETAHGQESQALELFVTPALFKRGNTEGELYADNSCMVKATVTCKGTGSEARE